MRDEFDRMLNERKADGDAEDYSGFDHRVQIVVNSDYIGEGYAKSSPAELDFICTVARERGLILDPVYTGKAFYGMYQELMRDPEQFPGEAVCFIHTGGIFGLMSGKHTFGSL